MSKSQTLIIKTVLAVIIVALLLSIKTIIFINLENLGFSAVESANIRTNWQDFYLDILFIIISIIASVIIALKFNVKGE